MHNCVVIPGTLVTKITNIKKLHRAVRTKYNDRQKDHFRLDGKSVEAAPDETIWQVAKREGTSIPHLCWLPEPGYESDGNCRACMVEIEGERVLAASCQRKVSDGLKVKTATERAKKSREMVFELLLADQPTREDAHDPKSKFWNWIDTMGVETTARYPKAEKSEADYTQSASQ